MILLLVHFHFYSFQGFREANCMYYSGLELRRFEMVMNAKNCQDTCGIYDDCQSFVYEKMAQICHLLSSINKTTCDTVVASKYITLAKCRSSSLQTRKFINNHSKFGKQRFFKGLN